MKDIFINRLAKPMLIGREEKPFNDDSYLYEPKLAGDRCLAYLDRQQTLLINRRGRFVLPQLPELFHLHKKAEQRCILDGEIVVGFGRKSEFGLVRARLNTTDQWRIKHQSVQNPVTYVAFDMLYLGERDILGLPLHERKLMLAQNIRETDRLALAQVFRGKGVELFTLARQEELEGVVGKHVEGLYRMGKRATDWVEFKNWDETACVIVGYWPSNRADLVSLVLAQNRNAQLMYVGHVSLQRHAPEFARILEVAVRPTPTVFWGPKPERHHKTIWLEPSLWCRIRFMGWTPSHLLRQPVFMNFSESPPL